MTSPLSVHLTPNDAIAEYRHLRPLIFNVPEPRLKNLSQSSYETSLRLSIERYRASYHYWLAHL